EPRKLRPAAHKQEPYVLTIPQALGQIDQNIHALRDAHIADVDEDLAASESRLVHDNAAPDIWSHGEPIVQHLQPAGLRFPFRQVGKIGRGLPPDPRGQGILEGCNRLEFKGGGTLSKQTNIDGPFRKYVSQDQIGPSTGRPAQRPYQRTEEYRGRI